MIALFWGKAADVPFDGLGRPGPWLVFSLRPSGELLPLGVAGVSCVHRIMELALVVAVAAGAGLLTRSGRGRPLFGHLPPCLVAGSRLCMSDRDDVRSC